MAVYLISYDLRRAQEHNYHELRSKIASFGRALPILESTFIVETDHSAKYMSDQIKSIYQPEKHFVIQLKNTDRNGVLANDYMEWINVRL